MNTNKPLGETLFIDLDGTLIVHNYYPDLIPDKIIETRLQGLMSYIKSINGQCILIITTSRSASHANSAVSLLTKKGLKVDSVIHSLPTGKRIIINDSKNGEKKAIGISVVRNKFDLFNFE